MRIAAATLCAVAAVVLAVGAHDVLAWRSALAHDRTTASAWLPGDPALGALALSDDVQLRRAIHSFDVAEATGLGFDFGETRDRVRSAAEVRLSDVAASREAVAASQAGNLLGVLVAAAGKVTGGVTADDRALDAFETAVRRDPSNTPAKYNLELLLRRTRATSTRKGAGNGAGSLGRGQRGAGAGTPGRGY
jgi:hypothetical protein